MRLSVTYENDDGTSETEIIDPEELDWYFFNHNVYKISEVDVERKTKFRVVCGACTIECNSLEQARTEAIKFNRGVIDELIDYYDEKECCWKTVYNSDLNVFFANKE